MLFTKFADEFSRLNGNISRNCPKLLELVVEDFPLFERQYTSVAIPRIDIHANDKRGEHILNDALYAQRLTPKFSLFVIYYIKVALLKSTSKVP